MPLVELFSMNETASILCTSCKTQPTGFVWAENCWVGDEWAEHAWDAESWQHHGESLRMGRNNGFGHLAGALER